MRALWIVSGLWVSLMVLAQDAKHYPKGNVAYSGNIIAAPEGSYKGVFPITLQVGVDPSFSEGQQRLIIDAMDVFVERAMEDSILDCAYKRSTKDFPVDRKTFEVQLYSALSPIYVKSSVLPSFAFIARYGSDPESVGIAYLDLFNDRESPLPGYSTRHYLHIALNTDHLGEGSQYSLARDVDYWAGVIGHEFLHNLGYDHPTGYRGSFIKEFGNCIWMNGARVPRVEELPDLVVRKGH